MTYHFTAVVTLRRLSAIAREVADGTTVVAAEARHTARLARCRLG